MSMKKLLVRHDNTGWGAGWHLDKVSIHVILNLLMYIDRGFGGAVVRASVFHPVSSIYIWSKNFSHSVNEKSEAKMAAIDVQ